MPIVLDPTIANPAPPTIVPSPDSIVTAQLDTAHAGVLLTADFSTLNPKPFQVRFTRSDGTTVRSGDPAWAPGGMAVAYDHEAKLGSAVSWQATPLFRDGSEGQPSQYVAMVIPEPSQRYCWAKPTSAPGLSMQLFVSGVNQPSFSQSAQTSFVQVPDAPTPIGSWSKRVKGPRSYAFTTKTLAERDAFDLLIDEGPMLLQFHHVLGIPDQYVMPGDSEETYLVGGWDPRRRISLQVQPIRRPPTIDAPLYVPGRSYAETQIVAPTYEVSQSVWPTYIDVLGGTFTPPDLVMADETGDDDGDDGGL